MTAVARLEDHLASVNAQIDRADRLVVGYATPSERKKFGNRTLASLATELRALCVERDAIAAELQNRREAELLQQERNT